MADPRYQPREPPREPPRVFGPPARMSPYPPGAYGPGRAAGAGPGADSRRRVDRGEELDPHELLKKQMFASASAGDDSHFEKNRPSPWSVVGISDMYVMLDSFSRVRDDSPARGVYRFNFMVSGDTRLQSIGTVDRLDTVTEIQVMPFIIPQLPLQPRVYNDPPTTTALPVLTPNLAQPIIGLTSLGSAYTQLPFGGRIVAELCEIGRQSFPGRNGNRYQFEFDTLPFVAAQGTADEITPPTTGALGAYPEFTGARLVPIAGLDTFHFTDPIKDIHGLTLAFRNPDAPVVFPEDCYENVRAVRAGGKLVIELPGSNLARGDRIFISGFNNYGNVSGPPAARVESTVLNNWLNRPEGQIVGDAGFVAGVSFRLEPDVDVATAPDPSAPAVPGPTPPAGAAGSLVAAGFRVCIAKNRLRIPLRIRRMVQRLTDYRTA